MLELKHMSTVPQTELRTVWRECPSPACPLAEPAGKSVAAGASHLLERVRTVLRTRRYC